MIQEMNFTIFVSCLQLGSMEPGRGRPPVQVVGENEALQQFFSGELSHLSFCCCCCLCCDLSEHSIKSDRNGLAHKGGKDQGVSSESVK